jgi:hypothetical protein
LPTRPASVLSQTFESGLGANMIQTWDATQTSTDRT